MTEPSRLPSIKSFASPSTLSEPGDQVALLPPVSGGLGRARVAADLCPCPPAARAHRFGGASSPRIKAGEDGAACLFDGIVRNHTRNRRTLYLEYDSYPAMALAEMERLALQALADFPVRDVHIIASRRPP